MLTILVVDNNLTERKVAESILLRQGFDVAACSTDEALALLSKQQTFDMAIVAHDLDLIQPYSGLLRAIIGIEGPAGTELDARVIKPYRQESLLASVFEAAVLKGMLPGKG